MKQTYETGLRGEKTAEDYLQKSSGMVCLERRYRTKAGEIDLIMREGETLVFVEVKTRRNEAPGMGLMAVNAAKQRRISRAAVLYLMEHHALNLPVRFDLVEICGDQILHIPNAFQPGGIFYR